MSSPGKPSRWSRVGSAVRRSTSLLATSRPTTPANEGDSSDAVSIKSNKSTSKSIKSFLGGGDKDKDKAEKTDKKGNGKKGTVQVDTTSEGLAVNPAVAGLMLPSVIAESPDREALETAAAAAAAAAAANAGPSPLSQDSNDAQPTFAAEPEDYVEVDGKEDVKAATTEEATSEREQGSRAETVSSTTSPVGYVPPPLLDSSVGNPGAFTDDPDSLPQPTVIEDPYAPKTQTNIDDGHGAAETTSSRDPADGDEHDGEEREKVFEAARESGVEREATLPAYELDSSRGARGDASEGQHPGTSTTQVMPAEPHPDEHSSIFMPLPPFNANLVAAQPLTQTQRVSNVGYDAGADANERTPLLGGIGSNTTANGHGNHLSYLGAGLDQAPVTAPQPRLHDLGWLEYHLPDGSFYYVHPTKRVTTDVNLRKDAVLEEVMDVVERVDVLGSLSHMGEVWLREEGEDELKKRMKALRRKGGATQQDVQDLKYGVWVVDHASRSVARVEKDGAGKGKGRESAKKSGSTANGEEDQLDMEYRYWSFMEAHPAHTTLDGKARAEAVDVLSWALTDRILPAHRAIPPPFSQEECQELMTLLKSFETNNADDHGIQTRVISRVLLRVAIWRQAYFRPSKPLPTDVRPVPYRVPGKASRKGRPVRRIIFDVVVGAICLGIPYLLLENRQITGNDWEVGRYGTASSTVGGVGVLGGPGMFVIGACTCLVAAIVLSTSVTYLSLPEVGWGARVAGMCAVVFASFAMAASMFAFFRYRAEVESVGVGSGGVQELVGLSKRAVVYSLPLVFLAYAIAACVVGIALYAYRGGVDVDPLVSGSSSSAASSEVVSRIVPVSKSMGEVYEVELHAGSVQSVSTGSGGGMRWGVLGLLGAVGGVLAMSWVVSKNSGVGLMEGGW